MAALLYSNRSEGCQIEQEYLTPPYEKGELDLVPLAGVSMQELTLLSRMLIHLLQFLTSSPHTIRTTPSLSRIMSVTIFLPPGPFPF